MELIRLQEVDSTNTYAREHFDELSDGSLVVTDHQTAGRGRCGRVWRSAPGTSIAATGVFRNLSAGFHGGCLVGLAALRAIREELPDLDVYFKWPNDLYIGNRKLAGILSEGVICGGRLVGTVSGIGINVNQTASDLENVGQPATSLRVAANREINLEKMVQQLAKSLFWYYIVYGTDSTEVLNEWKKENRLVGRELEFVTPTGESFRGIFSAIAEDGALCMTTSDGGEKRFNCGDVKILL